MMKNYDEAVEINNELNRPYIPDHTYRVLIISGSGSRKTNVLLNLRKHQILKKTYLYVKDPRKSKYQLLEEKNGLLMEEKIIQNPKTFIAYSQTIDHVYEKLVDYIQTNKKKC